MQTATQRELFPQIVNPDLSAEGYTEYLKPGKDQQTQNNSLAGNTTRSQNGSLESVTGSQTGTNPIYPKKLPAEGVRPKDKKLHTSMDMLKSHITLLESITTTPGDIWTNITQMLSDKKMAYLKALKEGEAL